jgi:hypothetical protein
MVSTNPEHGFNESSIWFQRFLKIHTTPSPTLIPIFYFHPFNSVAKKLFLGKTNIGLGRGLSNPHPLFPSKTYIYVKVNILVQPFVTNELQIVGS